MVARRYPLNFAMGNGFGKIKNIDGVVHVDELINEHAQLWTYRSWADWMDADNWAALKQQRTSPPTEGLL